MNPNQIAIDMGKGAQAALAEKPQAPETVHVTVRADQLVAVCQLAQSVSTAASAPASK
jgi:hypothetical protein